MSLGITGLIYCVCLIVWKQKEVLSSNVLYKLRANCSYVLKLNIVLTCSQWPVVCCEMVDTESLYPKHENEYLTHQFRQRQIKE